MDIDVISNDADLEGGHGLGKWRRRSSCVWLVLIAVPWAGEAAVDKFSFGERAILVLADAGQSGNFPLVAHHCDSLATEGHWDGSIDFDV